LRFLSLCFVATAATKQFSSLKKPFSPCGADVRKQRLVIKQQQSVPRAGPGDRLMRTLSFILAFVFLLAGPSMAGSPDNLPTAGAFAYNSAPAASSASLVLAAR
jgi:hypothetical protein